MDFISIDLETTGLNLKKDKAVILSFFNSGKFEFFRFKTMTKSDRSWLTDTFLDPKCLKIFHNACFDVPFLIKEGFSSIENIWCTKIAEKIINPKESSSLKDVLKRYFDIDISKEYQTYNWENDIFEPDVVNYLKRDVVFLDLIRSVQENYFSHNSNKNAKFIECMNIVKEISSLKSKDIDPTIFNY